MNEVLINWSETEGALCLISLFPRRRPQLLKAPLVRYLALLTKNRKTTWVAITKRDACTTNHRRLSTSSFVRSFVRLDIERCYRLPFTKRSFVAPNSDSRHTSLVFKKRSAPLRPIPFRAAGPQRDRTSDCFRSVTRNDT